MKGYSGETVAKLRSLAINEFSLLFIVGMNFKNWKTLR